MEVFYHPRFARQLEQLALAAEEDEVLKAVEHELRSTTRREDDARNVGTQYPGKEQ
ncbi:MAG: hypothetical protein OXC06_12670 [Acidimicrobiaceae bacterium]|nr:hypothetical protein [Acidimicrobiaceae bacterium]